MNSKTAIATLLLALLACAGLFWIGRTGKSAPAPSLPPWLAQFDPARASSLHIRWPDGEASLAPSRITDVWILSADNAAWPVATSRIRGALRLIAELNPTSVEESSDTTLDQSATTVTLATPAGQGSMKVGANVVGGRGWVELENPDGKPMTLVVDAGFTRLFSKAGVMAWREAAPLIAAPGETTRLTIEAGALKSQLSRVKGRWGMTVPVRAAAHSEFVQAATIRAHSMEVRRFLSATEGAAISFDSPTATLITETEISREPRAVLVQEAIIGPAADVEAGAAFVRASAQWLNPATGALEPAWGPLVMIVEKKSIEQITADPRAYISKRSVEAPAADVLKLSASAIGGTAHAFTRTLDGWKLGDAPADRAAESLVQLLCEKDAKIPELAQPRAFAPFANVELAGASGSFAKLTIGEAPNEKGAPLIYVQNEGVWREYDNDAPIVAWLKSLAK